MQINLPSRSHPQQATTCTLETQVCLYTLLPLQLRLPTTHLSQECGKTCHTFRMALAPSSKYHLSWPLLLISLLCFYLFPVHLSPHHVSTILFCTLVPICFIYLTFIPSGMAEGSVVQGWELWRKGVAACRGGRQGTGWSRQSTRDKEEHCSRAEATRPQWRSNRLT